MTRRRLLAAAALLLTTLAIVFAVVFVALPVRGGSATGAKRRRAQRSTDGRHSATVTWRLAPLIGVLRRGRQRAQHEPAPVTEDEGGAGHRS